MSNPDALGIPCGAGRIEQIRKVVRIRAGDKIIVRQTGDSRPSGIKRQDRRCVLGKAFEMSSLSQQEVRLRIPENGRLPFSGIGGIDRYIGRAGLETAQEADGHLQRSVHAKRDRRLRDDPLHSQITGELVAQAVQRIIGDGASVALQRHGIRCLARLRFYQAMERGFLRIGLPWTATIGKLQGLLAGREDRQLTHRCLRRGDDLSQQCLQMPGHPRDRVRGKEIRTVFEDRIQPSIGLPCHLQREIEDGGPRADVQPGSLKAREPTDVRGAILQHEHHLKERRVAEIPRHTQFVDQTLKGQVLMALRPEHHHANAIQQSRQRGIAGHIHPERDGVDKTAHQLFRFASRAVGHRGADAEIGLAAIPRQEETEGRDQQHERRGAVAGPHFIQATRELRFQRPRMTGASMTLDGRSRIVPGQVQQRRRPLQLIRPIFKQPSISCALGSLSLSGDQIDILNRENRQR